MINIGNQCILIVEDNDDDFESAYEALSDTPNFLNPVYRCENGQEALDYLYRKGKYSDPELSPTPALILLDLNLPGVDGRQVLATIKKDPDLKKLAVIVFTTSQAQVDIDNCYAAGANSYIQKPVNLENLIHSVKMMKEYWFQISVLPKEE